MGEFTSARYLSVIIVGADGSKYWSGLTGGLDGRNVKGMIIHGPLIQDITQEFLGF